VRASQTRDRGARRMMLFWIWSVLARSGESLLVLIGNLLVAHRIRRGWRKCNPLVA
jgi:hypothetical protein